MVTIVLLDVNPDQVAMELQVPLSELELAFGHDVTRNTETLVTRLGPQLKEYFTAHIRKLFASTRIAISDADKAALVSGLEAGTETRTTVLRKVRDGTTTTNNGVLDSTTTYGQAFCDQEYNAAFVLTQYFGYLRRDPDADGYAFWLAKLNQYGNFADAEMIRSFLLSTEYRQRFAQRVVLNAALGGSRQRTLFPNAQQTKKRRADHFGSARRFFVCSFKKPPRPLPRLPGPDRPCRR